MAERVQLNVRVPQSLAAKVRADARRNGKTVDSVLIAVIEDFFRGWSADERRKFYAHAPAKAQGAPQKEVAS